MGHLKCPESPLDRQNLLDKHLDLKNILCLFYADGKITYRLMRKKTDSSKLKKFISEKFKKVFIFLPAFYQIMGLMNSPKNFEKIAILN